eukprot:XP_011680329.1 PREDICTED: uncharacterized protein LOC105445895 [Strongylocentrotus purpuratus]
MDSSKKHTAISRVIFRILAIAVATLCTILVANSTFAQIRHKLNGFNLGDPNRQVGLFEKQELILKDKAPRKGREKRATTPGTPLLFSAENQQNLVDWHNDYRRQVSPAASNMEYMTWDDELAGWAQEWTDSCYYEHGFPEAAENERIGQNLWRGLVADLPDGSGPISSWWDEWQWYDYETDTCLPDKICGHYRQLVWDTSSKVGCARSFCAEGYDDTLNFTDNHIVACNYREQGNQVNIKPYETGTSCTRCTSGIMTCDNKLCRQCQDGTTAAECSTTCEANCQNCATLNADCTCTCQPQFTGVDCSVPCGDYSTHCGVGWPAFTCSGLISGFESVPDMCPEMCGQCTPDDGSFVCDVTTNGLTYPTNLLHTTTPGISRTTDAGDAKTPSNLITGSGVSSSVTAVRVTYTSTDPGTTPSDSGTPPPDPGTSPRDTLTTAQPDPTTAQPDPTTAQPKPTTTISNRATSSSSSTTSPSSCSQITCENGGTVALDACTCSCAEGFQGDDCSIPQEEIKQSVVFRINVNMNTWIQIQSSLQNIIAQVTTDYCNSNFGQCCPNYGAKTNSLRIDFASTNDVYIVGGYPKEVNFGSSSATETAVYIKPASITSSCEEGGNGSPPDSDSVIYIPQAILLAAIDENLDVIESQLGVSVDEVILGQAVDVVQPQASPGLSTAWIVGICLLTVLPLSIVAVGLLALKMNIIQRQRWWQWQQRHIGPTKVQPLDPRFTLKQELGGNPDIYTLRNF